MRTTFLQSNTGYDLGCSHSQGRTCIPVFIDAKSEGCDGFGGFHILALSLLHRREGRTFASALHLVTLTSQHNFLVGSL